MRATRCPVFKKCKTCMGARDCFPWITGHDDCATGKDKSDGTQLKLESHGTHSSITQYYGVDQIHVTLDNRIRRSLSRIRARTCRLPNNRLRPTSNTNHRTSPQHHTCMLIFQGTNVSEKVRTYSKMLGPLHFMNSSLYHCPTYTFQHVFGYDG